MWVLWDAGDDDRPFATALLAALMMGVSLCRSSIGADHPLVGGDVLVGFRNQGTRPATVELRHPKHTSDGPGGDSSAPSCVLRVEVPAGGSALAFHDGALVVFGLPWAHELVLHCDGDDVSAVYAVVESDERMALALHPDKVLPYLRGGIPTAV